MKSMTGRGRREGRGGGRRRGRGRGLAPVGVGVVAVIEGGVEDLGATLPAQAPRHGGRSLRIKWRGGGATCRRPEAHGRREDGDDDDDEMSRGRQREGGREGWGGAGAGEGSGGATGSGRAAHGGRACVRGSREGLRQDEGEG
jgi:hypothetical protein